MDTLTADAMNRIDTLTTYEVTMKVLEKYPVKSSYEKPPREGGQREATIQGSSSSAELPAQISPTDMTAKEMIFDALATCLIHADDLTYASYRAQRWNSPEISPERWGQIFPDWRWFEEKFQAERNDYITVTMMQREREIVERGANLDGY